jgi:2,4-dienoyl-CoA reductase-like NADH-dependent reductase (Old Yellow Enzyme family)
MDNLFSPLSFKCGTVMKNRFMLAPMTNQQSHEDGAISEDELHWLQVRAQGGFAHIVTCASHVSENGKGFPGALGVFSDSHIEGLTRLANALREQQSLCSVQLYHGGMRAISSELVSPSGDTENGSRAMTQRDIEETIEDFVSAAERAAAAGFDGALLHAAHGYLIGQFLSSTLNCRSDRYGGSLENRGRFLFDIVHGIRTRCGDGFQLGVRLSPELFGQQLPDIVAVARRLLEEAQIDYLDMSLWDVRKEPGDERYRGRSLMSYFTELDRGKVRLGVAGKIIEPGDAAYCLQNGADYVALGKVAVLHHDYPRALQENPQFSPRWLPATADYLRAQGLGETFIAYLATWTDFVEDYPVPGDAVPFDIDEYLKTGHTRHSQ